MDIGLRVWQVWITDRDPNKYRLVWECVKRSEAVYVADKLIERNCYYGVEVVYKSRRLPCLR